MKELKSTHHLLSIFLIIFNICVIFSQEKTNDIYSERRDLLAGLDENGIFVCFGNSTQPRNSDIDHKFRQASNFYYLTRGENPDCAVIIIPGEKYIFFRSVMPVFMQAYMGPSAENPEVMKADTIADIKDFNEIFNRVYKNEKTVYTIKTENRTALKNFTEYLSKTYPDLKTTDASSYVHKLRMVKQPAEIELLRKSINITCEAVNEIMKAARPGISENELEGILHYTFFKNGSQRYGFHPIVSSGDNLPILHYENNDQIIKNNDLIMADVGAEYGYYSADVTRTFPVNGKFSKEQKEVYDAVLNVINEEISRIKPGTDYRTFEKDTITKLKSELLRLGLITDINAEWQWRLYMLYGQTTHGLGLDTHDVTVSDNNRSFEIKPGMVFAVEPGIYVDKNLFDKLDLLVKINMVNIPASQLNDFKKNISPAFEKYKGICCRIEHDVLVTNTGSEILSLGTPVTTEEIENLMKQKSIFK